MIANKTFKVEVESEDGNAIFEFKKPKTNDILRLQESLKDSQRDLRAYFYMLKNDLVSVEGLFDSDGTAITPETIKNLDLDIDTINAIITAYSLVAFKRKDVSDEKKTS